MRKNKGYQRDHQRYAWIPNAHASGEKKSLEQYLSDIDAKFDQRVSDAKSSYAKLSKVSTLVGKALRDYCHDNMLWEVRFDGGGNIIPLEDVLSNLEETRKRYRDKMSYRYVRRIVHKDNQKFVFNSGSGADGSYSHVRVPSMKRSNAVWKRFYELFPVFREHYSEWNNKNGLKLKKVW